MTPTKENITSLEQEEAPYTFRVPILHIVKSLLKVATENVKKIMGLAILGALTGFLIAYLKPITYQSEINFFVEDSKGAGSSLMSMVAGQFGLDVGSATGGNGVLAGDNVLELTKSKLLLQKALLTPFPVNGKESSFSLADEYALTMNWKEKWKKSKEVSYEVSFAVGKTSFTRIEDSLLQLMMKRIVEKELVVSKPDKKLGFYSIQLETRNELLSKLISQQILSTTTNFYIDGKTSRLRKNLERLQKRVDSLGKVVNAKTIAAAYSNLDVLIDANQAMAISNASAEINSKDKTMANIVFGELLKNLEVAKTSLIQETPSIIVVDETKLPLKNELKWYWAALVGAIVGALLGLLLFFKFSR
jgi:predicted transcriptional regulator